MTPKRAAVTLGTGHPPGDRAGSTLLDVYLHPDCPDGPLSLGESWGRVSGVGSQFTLQGAVEHCADHLRACGCEWLIAAAEEERQAGRCLTPQEILDRQPVPQMGVTRASGKPPAAKEAPEGTLEKLRSAINSGDFEALESLRDVLTDAVVRELVRGWSPVLPWRTKDAYAALLQDQAAECVRPVFRDALRSPSVESRAYALCVLTGDFEQFSSLLSDGWVDAAKVDAAIAAAGLRESGGLT